MNTAISKTPGALPAAITAALAAPSTGPDAELIRICDEFEAAERQIQALYEPDEVDEDKAMEVMATIEREQMIPILGRMEEIRAQTAAGIHARALATSNPHFEHSFDAEGTFPERLLSYLMRDAMALEVRS